MVSYIMKSIAYSIFLKSGILPWFCLRKNRLERWIERMALGQSPLAGAKSAQLFLVSGNAQQVMADSLALLYKNSLKSSDLVIIWPGFEVCMTNQVPPHKFDRLYVVTPKAPTDIGPMMKELSSVGSTMAILMVNLAPWAEQYEEEPRGAYAANIYGEIHHGAQVLGWPLVVIEDLEGLSERNSAFLRRLFPRNTLI